MGTQKRSSTGRLNVRAAKDPEERTTLMPCPACNGSGQRVLKDLDRARYRVIGCRWCDGAGAVEHQILRVFSRWRRIHSWNLIRGRCRGRP